MQLATLFTPPNPSLSNILVQINPIKLIAPRRPQNINCTKVFYGPYIVRNTSRAKENRLEKEGILFSKENENNRLGFNESIHEQ